MNRTYQAIIVLGLVGAIGFLSSCEKEYYVPDPGSDPSVPVSFSTDMQPFFDAKCVSCHNGGGVPLDLSPATSYDNIISGGYVNTAVPENSSLYTKIDVGGSMESYATPAERTMTLNWITQGALDN